MDDKPLDLSKRSASSITEPHQHPTEKRQESIKDLGIASNISVFGNEKEFTEAEKNGDNLMKQDGVESRLSFRRSRRHNIPKSSNEISGNRDRSRTKMHYVPEKNSGSKRHKSFGSATDTKKHKSTERADPNCYKKASKNCIPSTSTGASCNYGTQSGEHFMKSKEKSTFDCEYCGKTWNCKSAYETHVRSHTGVKPYGCQHCGKRFTQKSNLKAHSLQHTGERPFPCNACQKAFYTNFILEEHLRTHTGEKPFLCDICNKTFRTKQYMTKHKKIHTKKPKGTSF